MKVEVAVPSLTVLIVSLNVNWICRAQEMCERLGDCPVPNSPYSLFERELDLQSSGAV